MKKAKLVFWLILIAIAVLFVYQNPEFFQAKHRLTLKLVFIDPLFTPELPTLIYFLVALGLGFLIAFLTRFSSQLKTRKATREMTAAIDTRDRKIKQLENELKVSTKTTFPPEAATDAAIAPEIKDTTKTPGDA
jgi:hypothetical protein